MRPNYEVGLCPCPRRLRSLPPRFLAGVRCPRFRGCGQPTAATRSGNARTTPTRSTSNAGCHRHGHRCHVGPLSVEELTRKTALEAELANERPTQRLKSHGWPPSRGPHRFPKLLPPSVSETVSEYSAFVVQSYSAAMYSRSKRCPATAFEVTPRDVRFSAEFPQFHFVKSPPYTIVTDESFGEVQKILVLLADLREQLHQRFAPLIKQDGELHNIHVVFSAPRRRSASALRTAPSFVNSAGFFSSGENRLALLNQLGTSRYTDAQVRLDERSHSAEQFCRGGPAPLPCGPTSRPRRSR